MSHHHQHVAQGLCDIFEPDTYSGSACHMPSINMMLAGHLSSTVYPDNFSTSAIVALSKRRNTATTLLDDTEALHSDMEILHNDIDDSELTDCDSIHSEGWEMLTSNGTDDCDYLTSPTSNIASTKKNRLRRRSSSLGKLRNIVGGLFANR
ncbi:hypothetical protein EV174_006395, partial [Coemansia sp. RSA 2320]